MTAKKRFVNRKEYPLEAGGLKGTFILPILMTEEDLSTYLTNITVAQKEIAERDKDAPPGLAIQVKMNSRKHLVRAIDFPACTLEDLQNGSVPFPAVSRQIVEATEQLIEDALQLKNS